MPTKGRRPMMDIRKDADRAYGFWNAAGAWVGRNPKTALMIAVIAIALVAVLI